MTGTDTRDARLRQAAADVRALFDAAEARGEQDVDAVMREAGDVIVRAFAREAVIEALGQSGLLPTGAAYHGGPVSSAAAPRIGGPRGSIPRRR